uniref:Uncharacterized protein n=1 Tax=Nelumbo nucifera TaxID=4432 RepID=A0A822ZM00_NELNU|nr:TPA_asm: hypothetical protein HUJ06_002735 [Nelumbo nucifera]
MEALSLLMMYTSTGIESHVTLGLECYCHTLEILFIQGDPILVKLDRFIVSHSGRIGSLI